MKVLLLNLGLEADLLSRELVKEEGFEVESLEVVDLGNPPETVNYRDFDVLVCAERGQEWESTRSVLRWAEPRSTLVVVFDTFPNKAKVETPPGGTFPLEVVKSNPRLLAEAARYVTRSGNRVGSWTPNRSARVKTSTQKLLAVLKLAY